MKVKYKAKSNVTGMRIATVRKNSGQTQAQFAVNLSDFMGRPRVMSLTTISAMESGRKMPSLPILMAISELHGVSMEYLLGMTQNASDTCGQSAVSVGPDIEKDFQRRVLNAAIPASMYRDYHNLPVFVTFPRKSHQDQWGIMDDTTHEIVLKDGRINYDQVQVQLYPFEMYQYDAHQKRSSIPMSSKEFLGQEGKFWVELKTADEKMRALYDGYYVFGKNRMGIVNVGNGEVLPVDGFALSYTVYKEPYDTYQYPPVERQEENA